MGRRDSVVGIATCHGLESSGFETRRGKSSSLPPPNFPKTEEISSKISAWALTPGLHDKLRTSNFTFSQIRTLVFIATKSIPLSCGLFLGFLS